MTMPDARALECFWADDPDTDTYDDVIGIPFWFPPGEALGLIRQIAESAPDDAGLCRLGVFLLEPLLDLHGLEIKQEVEAALAESAPLRKALSCADLHDLPREVADRWYARIQVGEDVGRSPADDG